MTSDEKSSSFRVSQLADTCPNPEASVRLSWGKCPSIQLVQATRKDRLHMKCRTRATIWDNADAERRCSKYLRSLWFSTFVGWHIGVPTFLKRSDRRWWSIRCSCCWWLTFDCLRKIIIINTSLHDCAHSTFSMGYVSRGKCRHGHLPSDTRILPTEQLAVSQYTSSQCCTLRIIRTNLPFQPRAYNKVCSIRFIVRR